MRYTVFIEYVVYGTEYKKHLHPFLTGQTLEAAEENLRRIQAHYIIHKEKDLEMYFKPEWILFRGNTDLEFRMETYWCGYFFKLTNAWVGIENN